MACSNPQISRPLGRIIEEPDLSDPLNYDPHVPNQDQHYQSILYDVCAFVHYLGTQYTQNHPNPSLTSQNPSIEYNHSSQALSHPASVTNQHHHYRNPNQLPSPLVHTSASAWQVVPRSHCNSLSTMAERPESYGSPPPNHPYPFPHYFPRQDSLADAWTQHPKFIPGRLYDGIHVTGNAKPRFGSRLNGTEQFVPSNLYQNILCDGDSNAHFGDDFVGEPIARSQTTDAIAATSSQSKPLENITNPPRSNTIPHPPLIEQGAQLANTPRHRVASPDSGYGSPPPREDQEPTQLSKADRSSTLPTRMSQPKSYYGSNSRYNKPPPA